MSKRPAEEDGENSNAKRPKTHDTRPASCRALMDLNEDMIGSTIASFLKTTEVNNLLRTCKTMRNGLNTNPDAWSPALQINNIFWLPCVEEQGPDVKTFYRKISPKLENVEIRLVRSAWLEDPDTEHAANYIATTIDKPLNVLYLNFGQEDATTGRSALRLPEKTWALFARSMHLKGVSLGYATISDDARATNEARVTAPSYVNDLTCPLDELHRHQSMLLRSDNITSLHVVSSDKEYKCKYCSAADPSECYMYRLNTTSLHFTYANRWRWETTESHFELHKMTDTMEILTHLTITGKTDRPQAWIEADLKFIMDTHPNKANLKIDFSRLQVVKPVEPVYVSFALSAPVQTPVVSTSMT